MRKQAPDLTGSDDGSMLDPQRQARLQKALARLSLFALESVDVPALMDESLQEIVRQLELEYALVLEFHPDEGEALVKAGAGWPDDQIREAMLPAAEATMAAHVRDSRDPVIVEDWSAEERFPRPALFEAQGVESSVAVRIAGRARPYGALCAAAQMPRSFAKGEVDFLKTVATIMGRVIELREAERDRLTADEEQSGWERFRALVESIPEQVWTARPDGTLNFVNRHVVEYLRGSSEEIIESGWFELMHPEDRQEAKAAWQEALEADGPFESEFRLRRARDEAYRWFLSRAVPMKGRGGEVIRWVGTNTDITQQKRDAIEHQRLATIVENVYDFVGSFNLDGELVFLNEAGRKMVGLSERRDPRTTRVEDYHLDDDLPFLREHILPTVRREGRWRGEFKLRQFETGEEIPVDADLFLTRDPTTGESEYIVAVYRDISPYKEAKEKAEQASKAKSEFLANMSHELRTPLNAVIGYSEMIREELEDIEMARAAADGRNRLIADLKQIHTAGNQLLNMVNDVLDISKIEAGEVNLHASHFDVCDMIEETESTIRPLVEENGNRFEVDCPEDIGMMHADRTKLRQGLFNLLNNAAKFTEDGRVTLRVRREEVDGEEGYAFAVEDTGIGISEEEKQDIFKAFSQADTSLTRKHEGAGLGLVITRNFCQMMGGDISFESEKGVGSTFTMHLPAEVEQEDGQVEARAGETTTEPEPVVPESEETPAERPAEKVELAEEEELVLVIDDDPRARELIARHLRKEGFAVTTARGGNEGLEAARKLHPTVITLDVMMPEKDGWAVLSELRADEELHDIPVVMVTIVDDEEMGYMLGAADYLTKPLNSERLVSVLRKYLDDAHCSVMLVEDDRVTRNLVRRTLEKESCIVTEAENGREALKQLDDVHPDVILLDLMMPEMDGFTFLENKQQLEEHRSVPVVIITAKDLTQEDRERLSAQAETVLQKGDYSREELLQAVSERVGRVAA